MKNKIKSLLYIQDELIVSPAWHEETLANREHDIKNKTAHFSELSEVKERLADRLESK